MPGVLSGGQPGGAEESLCHGLTTMTPLLAFDVALLVVVCQVGSLEEQDLLSSRAEEVAQSIRYCQVGRLEERQQHANHVKREEAGRRRDVVALGLV